MDWRRLNFLYFLCSRTHVAHSPVHTPAGAWATHPPHNIVRPREGSTPWRPPACVLLLGSIQITHWRRRRRSRIGQRHHPRGDRRGGTPPSPPLPPPPAAASTTGGPQQQKQNETPARTASAVGGPPALPCALLGRCAGRRRSRGAATPAGGAGRRECHSAGRPRLAAETHLLRGGLGAHLHLQERHRHNTRQASKQEEWQVAGGRQLRRAACMPRALLCPT